MAPPPQLEVHTSKSLSMLFIGLSGLALAILAGITFWGGVPWPLPVSLLFVTALAVGIHTLRHPRTLLQLDDREARLFSGTLWRNAVLVTIPRGDLLELSAREAHTEDGTECILRVTTAQPLTLTGSAARWAARSRRLSNSQGEPEQVLIWPLGLPHIGIERLNESLQDCVPSRAAVHSIL